MAELLCKTLGGVSPRGKARVYFACHPQDHKGYFQEITDELLKHCDCAIYYYEEAPELDEDYYLNLSQMQLMVMPVTSRLLYQPCRAMDVEFPYAMEHHIPVLPLMQEQDLERRFNEKCGDLQFLDKHNADPTAIPYAEKLKKYLGSVLIGDELAAKVRAAFDAYVFLSYRKKDRKFAQELMRLLHRDPRCRDIAIWYDEFLTPGENFNDSIREALEKSGLFVLAVTPNLVNETNYIMTTEYPMAKAAGKPVLPAGMQPTDPDALRQHYDGIPDTVDPQEEGVLTDAVIRALRDLALRENDADPQHRFFIGLAYLSGIDVEVDHAYAVKLITSAAESGLTEAMEKLVFMYENGEGVKRDYETAIAWREKLVEQARLRYEETNAEEDGYAYISKLCNLGDAQRDMNHLTPAKASYDKMRLMAEKLAESGTPESQRNLSISYERLGKIAERENDLPVAKEWYQRGLEICRKLAESGTPESQRDLSVSYDGLGGIVEKEGDLTAAKEWYQRGLEIRRKLAESGTPESQRNLSISYNMLGDIAEKEGDLTAAKAWYLRMLEINRKLAESGTPESQRDLSIGNNKLGGIAEEEGDLTAAKEWYQRGLEICRKLAESGTPESQRDLSVSYDGLGRIAEKEGDLTAAKEWYLQGLEIFQKLAESGIPESQRDLSVSYNKLGRIAEQKGDLPAAKKWYLQGLEIFQKLAESGTPESQRDLSVSYERLGGIARAEGNLSAAKKWYLQGLGIRRKLAESGTPESQRDLSISYDRLGRIAEKEYYFFDAIEWYKQSLEIRRKLAESTWTVRSQDDLAHTYYQLGRLVGDVEMVKQAEGIYLQLATACPGVPLYKKNAEIIGRQIARMQSNT